MTADWCQDPWALGNTGCLDGSNLKTVGTENLIQYSQYKNVPIPQIRLAVFGNNVPGSAATVTTHAIAYKAMGANVVYSQSPIPSSVTDFTPYADQILASKPTLVISYTSVADSLGIFGAMKAAGYKGDIMNGTGEIPGLFQNAAIESVLNGAYSYSADFPVPEEGTPVIKQEQSDLAGYRPAHDLGPRDHRRMVQRRLLHPGPSSGGEGWVAAHRRRRGSGRQCRLHLQLAARRSPRGGVPGGRKCRARLRVARQGRRCHQDLHRCRQVHL